jgi:hypothetical protein
MQAINPSNGMLQIIKVSQYQQDYICIPYRLASSGRPRRWYCLNRFTLSITSSPTFVGFFVCKRTTHIGEESSVIFVKY